MYKYIYLVSSMIHVPLDFTFNMGGGGLTFEFKFGSFMPDLQVKLCNFHFPVYMYPSVFWGF